MLAYVGIVITLLWAIGFWVPIMIKDSVLWFCLTGFVMLSQFVTDLNKKAVFWSVVRASVKLVIFIEFLVGAYTFSLLGEMFFVPIVTFLILLDSFAESSSEYADVKKVAGFLVAVIGFGILFFVIYRAIGDWRNLGSFDTLRSIAFAPLMSIAFVPFIYTTMVVAAYENLLTRLKIGPEKSASR